MSSAGKKNYNNLFLAKSGNTRCVLTNYPNIYHYSLRKTISHRLTLKREADVYLERVGA